MCGAALVTLVGFSPSQAAASTITYQVANKATALITTGSGTITLTLTDIAVNPSDVTFNVSGFSFTLSSAPSSESIASSSSVLRTVAGGGTYTDGATVAPGWAFSLIGAVTTLDDLGGGGAGPAHTIIGAPAADNKYDAANGGIAGNNAHNPFLDQTATWTFTAAGVTAATTVTATTFQFGTTDGANQFAGVAVATPEPASIAMMIGAAGLGLIWRRRFRTV
jgi:hypothetical protein